MSEPKEPVRRKRTKTARSIQHSTLHLAATLGYDSVTIEMIADHAGISRRTFFNHYRNKQEALAGPHIDRFGPELDWFVTSDGSLLPDLDKLVRQILTDASPERAAVQNIGKVLKASPDLQPVFSALIDNLVRELQSLLDRRLGPGEAVVASLVARLVAHAIALAFRSWTMGDDLPVEQTADAASENIRRAVEALSASPQS
ncbi:TetR/AcrR family transcriptional regulator [Palleronia sp.]|uniref:TetR/AcrR family transcriptional regulator n=1 Tax=Palleronia sp. TaxID=1940284 RepID=UPI0035C7D344